MCLTVRRIKKEKPKWEQYNESAGPPLARRLVKRELQ